MSTTFVSDSMTEGSDTLLSSHTPETGGAWSQHPVFSANTATVLASEDRVRGSSTSSSSVYLNAATPPDADYEIAWKGRIVTAASSRSGAVGRYDSTANTGYVVFYDGSQWSLTRNDNNVATELATWNGSESLNTDYAIQWFLIGNTHEVYFDGVLRMFVEDQAPITAAGKVGIIVRQNGRVDDFIARTLDDASSVRLAQAGAEVFASPDPQVRLAQAGAEVFASPDPSIRLAQAGAEVFASPDPQVHLVQCGIEVFASAAAVVRRININ